jgi:molybdate transport system ATP-binding protein
MSVLHNVMATGASEASAREWIAAVRMKGLEHQRPARLSGGQQQRAALARALAREPKLLLLDEPFAAVDQLTRERLYEELADLRRRLAIPVVFVTHSLVEAQTLADHMVVLHRGRTLQHGTPEEIFRTPQSADIARLVAHKNILTASIVRHDANATHLQWSGVELIAASRPELAVGSTVDWLIPALDVRLIWPEDVELSRRGNFFAAHIENLVPLGGHVSVHIRMPNNERLLLSVAAHIVRRRQLGIGGEVSVSLIPSSIHLMRRS